MLLGIASFQNEQVVQKREYVKTYVRFETYVFVSSVNRAKLTIFFCFLSWDVYLYVLSLCVCVQDL